MTLFAPFTHIARSFGIAPLSTVRMHERSNARQNCCKRSLLSSFALKESGEATQKQNVLFYSLVELTKEDTLLRSHAERRTTTDRPLLLCGRSASLSLAPVPRPTTRLLIRQ